MKKLTPIAKFKKGDVVQGFYLCVEKNMRQTKGGDFYLDLELRDITGKISAKVWDNVATFSEKFDSGSAVAVSGYIDSFLERLQLNVKKINKATIRHYSRYGFDPANIVPTSKKDPGIMWKHIESVIRNISNKKLRRLVTIIYKSNKKELMIHPASIKLNHNYRSGLLEHVFTMSKVAEKVCKLYDVDRDLVITGILLNNIGKLKGISSGYEYENTKEGKLISQSVLGREIVIKAISRISKFPTELSWKIEHIILSQETLGKSRNQNKIIFPEALLVHFIDLMNSQMNIMEFILENDHQLGDFTSKHNFFQIPILKKNEPS